MDRSGLVWVAVLSTLIGTQSGRAADCNGNGRPDREEIAAGEALDCNANGLPDECEAEERVFVSTPEFEVPGAPLAVGAGDFDGDGQIDYAVATRIDRVEQLAIFFAAARPADPPAMYELDAGTVYRVVPSDLDGDGRPDLVVLSRDNVLTLLNLGDGRFSEPRRFVSTTRFRDVGIADIDGNGRVDLLLSGREESRVTVLLGRGDGTFRIGPKLPVGEDPRSLAVIDVDGDGLPDVVTANYDSGDISVVLNSGSGRFRPSTTIALDVESPANLVAADFDGDGDVDLALTVDDDPEESAGVAVLLNSGDGTFSPSGRIWLGNDPTFLVTADFDGDGDADLASPDRSSNELTLFANRGDGTFIPFPNSTRGRNLWPKDIVPVDVDGDADIDLVTLIGSTIREVITLRNTGLREVDSLPDTLSINEKPFGAAGGSFAGTLADLNGDGALDLVETAANGLFQYRLNDGAGLGEIVRTGQTAGAGANDVLARDLDADGDVDIVFVALGTTIFHNEGDGTFRSQRVPASGRTGAILDLNGDGALDFVAYEPQNRILSAAVHEEELFDFRSVRITATGPRPPPAVGRVIFALPSLVAGDFDGDGLDDFAVGENTTTGELRVFLNGDEVQTGLAERRFDWPAVFLPTDPPTDMLARDVDGDGDVDLVTCSFESSTLSVFQNPGDGNFTPPLVLATAAPPHSVVATDLDGDGRIDVVTVNVDRTLSFFRALEGAFLPGETLGNPTEVRLQRGNREVRLGFAAAGDVDGDGDADIVASDQVALGGRIFENESPGSSSTPFSERICTERDFRRFSVPSTQVDAVERVAKFIVPVRPDDPGVIPPLFQNVWRFPLHQEFLESIFPEQFPALGPEVFDRLVNRRETREYFVGVVSRLRTPAGSVYGFTILLAFDDFDELPTVTEVGAVYESLQGIFTLEPLEYFPATLELKEAAESWPAPGFPIHFDDPTADVTYQPYTRSVGFGRVRLLGRREFDEANASGEISFQDILVLERAPRDIEGVFGGVITAEVQGELSHLALRTARRGTPNAFVQDALAAFAPFDGELVRLEVSERDYTVRVAEPEEARTFWDDNRRQVADLPGIDTGFDALPSFAEMELSAGGEFTPEARFGGKATNLARLQRILGGDRVRYQERGFAIPVRYYLEFLAANRMPSALDQAREVTYAEYVAELLESAEFESNSRFRFGALNALREHMREASVVDDQLVARLAARIETVFGWTDQRVRFRSSSNVEDALEFNGAGLYDSTSVCTADDLDDDLLGPSICDPTRGKERGIARGLRTVWSSLWNFRAYEERAFYGIPQELAAMGVLVNRAFVDERANGVAFTGNPGDPLDRRYVITVQAGEEPVVSPEPGVVAEKDLLEVIDGHVVGIRRAARSSLVPRDTFILSDTELEELGALLWHIDRELPIELGQHRRSDVLFDVEFKIESSGDLAVKQVRPFLLNREAAPVRTLTIEVPPGSMVCRPFEQGIDIRTARSRKTSVRLAGGRYEIPGDVDTLSLDLEEEVQLSEDGVATATGPGTLDVRRIPGAHVLDYERAFETPLGEMVVLRLSSLVLPDDAAATFVLDEAALGPPLTLWVRGEQRRLESCSLGDEEPTDLTVSFSAGGTLRLRLRHSPPNPITWIGPTRFVSAELDIPAGYRLITDYWKLVYRADRHHENSMFWVFLEPPIEIGADAPASVIQVQHQNTDGLGQEPAIVSFLDEDFRRLRGIPRDLRAIRTTRRVVNEQPFQRGDVSADGRVDQSDALGLLMHLFRADVAPPCRQAADANDDGTLSASDAIRILSHLFGGTGPLAPPFGECGASFRHGALGCEEYPPCG